MKKQPAKETTPARFVTVLSVSPFQDDHRSLEGVFSHSKWILYQADRLTSAMAFLREREIAVVLCEHDLLTGTWSGVLDRAGLPPDRAVLIVTSRLADDWLWAAALNSGAYDVLLKPFDQREVVRSVSLAWQHWFRQQEKPATKTMSASG